MFIFEGLNVEVDLTVTHADGAVEGQENEKDEKEVSE